MPKNHSNKSPKKHRSQRKDAGSTTCPDCDHIVRKRGMGSHRAHCKKSNRGRRETALDIMANEGLVLQDVEVEMQQDGESISIPSQPQVCHNILTSVNLNNTTNSEPPATALIPAQNDLDDDPMDGFLDLDLERQANVDVSETNAVGPLDYDDSDEDVSSEFTHYKFRTLLDHYGLTLIDKTYIISIDTEPTTFENTVHINDSEFLPTSQPEKDDIRIEYNDKSGMQPIHLSFDEYSFNNSQERESGRNVQTNAEPWRPFTSRLDFEVAELILETHLNKNQTNSLLSLIRRCINDPTSFSLDNSKDINALWEAARTKTTTVSYCVIIMSIQISFQ